MNKEQLNDFVTKLLDGVTIPEGLFDVLLNVSQAKREGMRPWMVLRAEDSTVTIGANNTFETENDLPTDFRSWYTRFPIALVDAQGNVQQYLREVPYDKRHQYKGNSSRFAVNYKTKKFYVLGAPGTSLTAHLFYVGRSTLVSANDSNEWIFDEAYHPILGFDVAAMYKHGVDYDVINNPQGDEHAAQAEAMIRLAENWDAELQESTLEGQDYYGGPSGGFTATGGRLSNLQ